jgi:hypothetical protein
MFDEPVEAENRTEHPQVLKIDVEDMLRARVKADLRRPRTPEDCRAFVFGDRGLWRGPHSQSSDAGGRTVAYEAIYQ